jgi:hypothetical protein
MESKALTELRRLSDVEPESFTWKPQYVEVDPALGGVSRYYVKVSEIIDSVLVYDSYRNS